MRELIRLSVAHSPDADDAFMFYALSSEPPRIPTGRYRFEHVLADIETLNRAALEGRYAVSALSFHAYAYVADRYALLGAGASMAEADYGPIVVATRPFEPDSLYGARIAVPGLWTSAYLALRLRLPVFEPVVMPFDQILGAVARQEVPAGLIIHEGQLSYRRYGLYAVLNLGRWWYEQTGLPLPLGGNVVRRDLGPDVMRDVARLLRQSVLYALEHRREALEYALRYARDLNPEEADRFVSMYVNRRTVDYGPEGRQAVQRFLDRGYQAGWIPRKVTVDFVDAS
ncbi:MAG: MqnA/MqnD/SBP family protein [Bacteroidota bacterium]|nr:MqnA/MqnD/SBP family protein [Bacteroidota bacterium]